MTGCQGRCGFIHSIMSVYTKMREHYDDSSDISTLSITMRVSIKIGAHWLTYSETLLMPTSSFSTSMRASERWVGSTRRKQRGSSSCQNDLRKVEMTEPWFHDTNMNAIYIVTNLISYLLSILSFLNWILSYNFYKVQLCDSHLLPRAHLDLQVAAEGEARRHPQLENPLRDGSWKARVRLLPGKAHHHHPRHPHPHQHHLRWLWCKTSSPPSAPNCWRQATRPRSWWSRSSKTLFRQDDDDQDETEY